MAARFEKEELEGAIDKEFSDQELDSPLDSSTSIHATKSHGSVIGNRGMPLQEPRHISNEEALEHPARGRGVDSRSLHSSNASIHTLPDLEHGHVHQAFSRGQSSVRSVVQQAEKVPRKKRRGLLAQFSLVAELTNPYAYPRSLKWFLTFVVAVAAAAAPMGSSIVLPALQDIEKAFNSTPTIVNLSVALWMLSMSIFPLWWSSFSETLGRRTIYVVSFALYLVFNFVAAISSSIGMFLAMRILAGGAAASVQSVGAGTIADLWEVKERGKAMGLFYLGPLCGPLISPIVGGAMTQSLGWRSVQWFLGIFGGVVLVLIICCLPETLREQKNVAAEAQAEAAEQVKAQAAEKMAPGSQAPPVDLVRTNTKQSVKLRTKKYSHVLRRCFIDPLKIVLYVQFPAVAICVAYSSITFGSLYVLNISVQATFSARPYNYSSIIIGLLYLPNTVGYVISSVFGGRWVDNIMHREARKAGRYDERGRLQFRPEDRMKENAWLGGLMYPAALIMYGWTAAYGVNIAAPMIANFFFGVGSMLIFAIATTMLTEFMPKKSSNGVALNNFVRNILSCVGTIVAEPLIVAIGNGWLFTGIAVISLVTGCFTVWAMRKYGDQWRVNMDKRVDQVIGD